MPSAACCHSDWYPHPCPTRRSSDLRHVVIPSAGAGGRDAQGIPPRWILELWFTLLHPSHQLTLPSRCATGHCPEYPLSRGPTNQCPDRKSTRLNSSHLVISYAVCCLLSQRLVPTPLPYTTLFRSAARRHPERGCRWP